MATGLLVESHEGRPTKVEGNPDHPASLGATDLFAQGSVLTLYDPDRSQTVTQLGEIRPWSAFVAAVRSGLSAQAPTKGAGPPHPHRDGELARRSPRRFSRCSRSSRPPSGSSGSRRRATTRARARSSRSASTPSRSTTSRRPTSSSRSTRTSSRPKARPTCATRAQFAGRRTAIDGNADTLNRLYVVEPNHTVTGGRADHRLPIKASQVEGFARAVAAKLGVAGISGAAPAGAEKFVDAVAADLAAHKGRSAVMAGDAQPAAVHAIAHAINAALENANQTVTYLPTPEAVPTDQHAALRELVADIDAGKVQMLVIIGESNPVLSAPADFKFAEAMGKVALRIHSGLFNDETATLSQWHVPAAHYLEAWSDARTIDGTVSIVQPLIQPMYGGKSAHEIVATMSDRPERAGYDIVREYWQAQPLGVGVRGDVREVVAQVAARRVRRGLGVRAEGRHGGRGSRRRASRPAPPSTASR